MKKKLFVGNLDYDMRDDDLKEVFSEYGNVVYVKVVMDNQRGRSKGFGFVEFETEEAAKKAMEELNETEVNGRTIYIDEAKESNN